MSDAAAEETAMLTARIRTLERRLADYEDTLAAIRSGKVDALVIEDQPGSTKIYTLDGADRPYRELIEQMQEGAVSITADSLLLYCNARLAAMLGLPRERVIGQRLSGFLMPDDAKSFSRLMAGAKHAAVRAEFNLRGPSGAIPVSISLSPLPDAGGTLMSGIVADLTEQKQHLRDLAEANSRLKKEIEERERAETALRHAQKMEAIGTVAGGMAHDFNNLLCVIILNLDFVTQLLDSVEDARSHVHEALDAANRGADLTRGLLAFSRRQTLNPVLLDLNGLVHGMHRLLSRVLGEDIEISLDLADHLWPVIADRSQIEASIANLATNARDAMPKGGSLVIATANRHFAAGTTTRSGPVAPGDYAMIAVSDSGVGMEPELLAKIFEPFFTTKAQGKGTGLGLSMVFGFASQSAGHLIADSTPGVGTTIRLFLPKAPAGARPGIAPLAPRKLSDDAVPDGLMSRGETVLVVEDNAAVRRIVVHELAALGYRVIEAEEPKAALVRLETEPVDLMFSDVVMPGGIDGFDLASLVLRRWPSVRVMLTSGFTGGHRTDRDERPLPRIRLLNKPYHRVELARATRQALDSDPVDGCLPDSGEGRRLAG